VDIRRRFDEILDFAEVGKAIDTPVKFFSSGMQLRLGFSIAVHLEPDIFVVDEALAVGDAGFQAKCVDRMTKLVAEGRTLIFVSHDLSAIEAACTRGAFLRGGKVASEGPIEEVLRTYVDWVDSGGRQDDVRGGWHGGGLTIDQVTVHGDSGIEQYAFTTGDQIEIRFHVRADRPIPSPFFSIGLSAGGPGTVVLLSMLDRGGSFDLPVGRHVVTCRTAAMPMGPRPFELWTSVRGSAGLGDLIDWSHVGDIRFLPDAKTSGPNAISAARLYSPVVIDNEWSVSPASEGES
jgi:hypothetical protein